MKANEKKPTGPAASITPTHDAMVARTALSSVKLYQNYVTDQFMLPIIAVCQ
jgi:hypothetical protein